jgi:hypothetical protein
MHMAGDADRLYVPSCKKELHCQHSKADENGRGNQPSPADVEPAVKLDIWLRKGFVAVLAACTDTWSIHIMCWP